LAIPKRLRIFVRFVNAVLSKDLTLIVGVVLVTRRS